MLNNDGPELIEAMRDTVMDGQRAKVYHWQLSLLLPYFHAAMCTTSDTVIWFQLINDAVQDADDPEMDQRMPHPNDNGHEPVGRLEEIE